MTSRNSIVCAILSIAAAAAVLSVVWMMDRAENRQYQATVRALTLERTSALRSRIEQALNARLRLADDLDILIKAKPGFVQDYFAMLAGEVMSPYPDVRALELAPDEVVTHVHPKADNKRDLGLDYKKIQTPDKTLNRSLEHRSIVLNGPSEDSRGARVLIGKKPVYLLNPKLRLMTGYYWGLAIVVIDLDAFMNFIEWPGDDPDLRFALRGKDGLGKDGGNFHGDPTVFERSPTVAEVKFPNGSWQVAAVPKKGWNAPRPGAAFSRAAGVVFAVFVAIGVCTLVRLYYIRKAAEAGLRKATLAKSEFLAKMSHELRTPLNAIIGFSEAMVYEVLGEHKIPEYKGYAEDIQTSGLHLLDLVNTILDLEKIAVGKYELHFIDFDPVKLIGESLRLIEERARKAGIELVTVNNGKPPNLHADMRAVKQVLLNLLSNAVKFTGKGGTITVKSFLGDNDCMTLVVSDSGIGIAEKDIEKAMSEFGQVVDSSAHKHQGTGLGLPLAKMLIEMHGGTFQLQSEPGVGTEITMIFPPECTVIPPEPEDAPPAKNWSI